MTGIKLTGTATVRDKDGNIKPDPTPDDSGAADKDAS